jgi:hypothetical protein
MQDLATEEQRRRAIALAISWTAGTTLTPDQFEQDLLESYAQGSITLAQLRERFENPIQHLLYRSKATHPLTADELTDLVTQAQVWNGTNQVTGLLCYSDDGHFVQVLEGPAPVVHALYARIQRDTRHTQVTTLSDKATPTRWFPDWKMALVETNPQDFFWLIGYLEAITFNLVKPRIPIMDPHLLVLLKQFSQTGG